MNSFLLSAFTLCLAVQCSLASYQSAPTYGYQQQRKMAPSPQIYGQAQQQQQQLYMPEQQYETAYEAPTSSYKAPAQYEERSPATYPTASKSSYGRQQSTYGSAPSYTKPAPAKYEEPYHPPMPFAWGYDINDGYGGAQYHKENGDEYGKRTGSYGYTDAYGIYRQVDYVADEHGFRATIKTNEPGTANESPADVDLHAYEPPSNYYAGNTYSAPAAKPYSAPASSYTPAAPVVQARSYQKPASSYNSKQQYSSKPAYSTNMEQSQYSSSALVPVYQRSAAPVAPKLQLITTPIKLY